MDELAIRFSRRARLAVSSLLKASHRCRSSVYFGRALHFCLKIMYEKLTKCPKLRILRGIYRKVNKISDYLRDIDNRKIPDFYTIIARKSFTFFGGGGTYPLPSSPLPSPPPLPISYAYAAETRLSGGKMTAKTPFYRPTPVRLPDSSCAAIAVPGECAANY